MDSDELKAPMVSVIVVSYNSGDFIVETLDSIQSQSYRNIELIVSDDGSVDQTVELVQKWIETHGGRFSKTLILSPEKNTGIVDNCNRGVRASSGRWIKLLAADDLLLPNCIADYIQYVNRVPCDILLGNVIHFLDGTSPKEVIKHTEPYWGKGNAPKNADEQYHALLLNYCGNTVSLFFKRSLFDKIPFDERFQFLEDYPFLLNVTKAGHFIHHIEKDTAMYRVRPHSVYYDDPVKLFSDFYKKRRKFDETYRFPYVSALRRKSEQYRYRRLDFLNRWKYNRKTPWNKFVFAISKIFNFNRYLMFIFDRKNL